MSYDIILGQDLLKELGFIINYKDETMTWDDATIGMKPLDAKKPNFFALGETDTTSDLADRMSNILAAKYAPADSEEVA